MATTNAVRVGSHVTVTPETATLLDLDAVTIYEVIDARGVGGDPMLRIAPIIPGEGCDYSRVVSPVFRDDLCIVGEGRS